MGMTMNFETWAEANWMYVDSKADAKVIWDAAVAMEREACARIAEDFDAYDDESTGTGVSSGIAASIRARG
jgi:hypothetical protein